MVWKWLHITLSCAVHIFANVQYDRGFPILLISLVDTFFTSDDFILYCFDTLQLTFARENFDVDRRCRGYIHTNFVRSPLPVSVKKERQPFLQTGQASLAIDVIIAEVDKPCSTVCLVIQRG